MFFLFRGFIFFRCRVCFSVVGFICFAFVFSLGRVFLEDRLWNIFRVLGEVLDIGTWVCRYFSGVC